MIICDRDLCTGCAMCENICPFGAIEMKEDEYGITYPFINDEKCTSCGLCTRKCPQNNEYEPTSHKVYAAWNKNKSIRKNSTSGGIFTPLAEEILSLSGVVFGCAFGDGFRPEHICIDNKSDIKKLTGSKYARSNTSGIYSKVKEALDGGNPVLFSGTPCQVHALNLYLGKPYENLFTVDFVCHGVPPYKLLKRHLDEICGDGKVKSLNFRYKNPCYSFASVRAETENGVYMRKTIEDAYFNLFNFNYSLRHSCHSCKYTNENRVSDITLCDFWGYSASRFKMTGFSKGVSCIITNTEKGGTLLDKIKDGLVICEETMEKAKRGNLCLSAPFPAPEAADAFFEDFKNGMTVADLNKKYIKTPYTMPKFHRLREKLYPVKYIIRRLIK